MAKNQKRPIRVIIVEEEENARDSLEVFLEADDGLEFVAAACRAGEAVQLCRAADEQPDVALMDLDALKPEEGVASIRMMRESCPGIAIVALADYGQLRLKRAVLGAGAAACLPKGIHVEQLAAMIRRACRREPLPS